MIPAQTPTINPDDFSRREEPRQRQTDHEISRLPIQKMDATIKENIGPFFWKDNVFRAVKLNWDELRQKIINWRNKHRKGWFAMLDRAHELSISILQQRYGFTMEKATSEFSKHYSHARLG